MLLVTAGPALAQEDAVASLRAAKGDGKDPNAALALGKALRRAGRFDEARVELGRGVLLPDARKTGSLPTLLHELALTHIDKGDFTGALLTCKKLTELPDSRALGHACFGEAHLMHNRATEALPEVEKALSIDSTSYVAKVVKGRIFAFQQKLPESEQILRAAIAQDGKRPEAHHHLGRVLLNQARAKDAIAPLKEASRLDPGNPHLLADLGEALGLTKEAQAAYEASVKAMPSFARGHAGLARVAAHRGELVVAEQAGTKAIQLEPTSFDAHVALGSVRLAQKQWDAALKLAEKAQKLVPNKASAEILAADAHAGQGDIDLAVEAYQRAYGFDRATPEALVKAARACRLAGRLTTARGFADRATGDFPERGDGWVEQGEIALKQAQRAKAKTSFQKALSLGGDFDRAEVQKRIDSL